MMFICDKGKDNCLTKMARETFFDIKDITEAFEIEWILRDLQQGDLFVTQYFKTTKWHCPTNAIKYRKIWLKVLSIILMRTDQEKGDLGVITIKNQVTSRTIARKSMGNQWIGSHRILKMMEKVHVTIEDNPASLNSSPFNKEQLELLQKIFNQSQQGANSSNSIIKFKSLA
ncbi:hypothetical protein AAG906_038902 [Vitis piasezkii]